LQEIYLAAEGRIDHFRSTRDMPFAVWIRLLADQRLVEIHRKHLLAKARSVNREVSMNCFDGQESSAANLAARLADGLTSPSSAAVHRETMDILTEAIDAMEQRDREVLILRHFDELTNDEVARFLDIPKATASKRYVRALARLRDVLEQIPGLLAESVPESSKPNHELAR
jgi:RNA polymerase sigma-70 factor (ECF subfamily)